MKQLSSFYILCVLSVVKSANILGFFHFPSLSHQYVFRAIVKELSLKGHQVTFVTPNPMNDPTLSNLTEIDISVGYKKLEKTDMNEIFSATKSSLLTMIKYGASFIEEIVEMQMEVDDVKSLLKKPDNSFDLILIEALNPLFVGLKHKFDAPLITIASLGLGSVNHEMHGNPVHPIIYPETLTGYSGPLTSFREKIISLLYFLSFNVGNRISGSASHFNKLSKRYFGDDTPLLADLIKEISISFESVNPIFSDKRPLAPNVFRVWNIHLNRTEILPNDLKKILDDSTNGVVYFSLGTNVRFGHLEGDFKGKMLEALGDLPYTVLCKWESEDYPNKPKNVVLRKFFPQQSILSHRNIKLFVTQGGLQSSEEAISNGVPLVVIPFLGDQPMNARILTGHGMAETISPKDLTKENLRDTIMKVANDEKYRLKAQELRNIFLDQPESGIDKIVWWCEYVMRHKGAKHLRSPSADIPLYEYFMLDVFAVLFAALFVFYKLARFVLPKIFTLSGFCKKDKTKLKKH